MNNLRTLPDTLRHALDSHPDGPLCVAFSGGPDSTALLHALAALPQARARGLRAVHVDHGLHPASGAWAAQAAAFCASLDVRCEVRRVEVPRAAGEGLEAAARHARYAAFAGALHPGEWLLLGHHRDDQAETVLLKLLRGAGPQGLGGMRAVRPLGRGQLWRPLLALPRTVLRNYIEAHALPCIDDPSNQDTALARNHLRHDILPRMRRHWPHAVDSILHSAALCRAADEALRAHWLEAFAALHDSASDSLDAQGWLALDPALREPLLDHWLHAQGLPAPTTAQRRQIERQCHARPGQQPCVRWPGVELHIWRGRLWALAPRPPIDPHWQACWRGAPLTLPDGGQLALAPAGPLGTPFVVRLRRGGERIRPAGDRHTRELRDLFQQAGVPPWRREACPLLYAEGELIAVADLWRTAHGSALFDAAGAQPRWMPAA
ncbi:MAG TPA: tRNA lysidine(34) synthetase TilS [Frateuria sp.]|uniref:tRNA lysidine(34) synthetase TilS n=1 Tax=Frateuria sp. TaxID=2211372 RepID=UPI002D7F0D3E|nr:tRNA lysidine(34) synthetase TilS [Frateuria sp.]HET6806681.1 tRNA lysidine(34) synthetase TilS [Frateuria sp.]